MSGISLSIFPFSTLYLNFSWSSNKHHMAGLISNPQSGNLCLSTRAFSSFAFIVITYYFGIHFDHLLWFLLVLHFFFNFPCFLTFWGLNEYFFLSIYFSLQILDVIFLIYIIFVVNLELLICEVNYRLTLLNNAKTLGTWAPIADVHAVAVEYPLPDLFYRTDRA